MLDVRFSLYLQSVVSRKSADGSPLIKVCESRFAAFEGFRVWDELSL